MGERTASLVVHQHRFWMRLSAIQLAWQRHPAGDLRRARPIPQPPRRKNVETVHNYFEYGIRVHLKRIR